MKKPYVVALKKTEIVDGVKWRRLPAAVEHDGNGGFWIPERRVEWVEVKGNG